MSSRVQILPSGHQFIAEPNEPILEAALRSGLNLDYRCNNGTCGQCKARITEGEVKQVQHHDYVLSEAQKVAGYRLLCCYSAESDLVVEASEASGASDIPRQQVLAKVRKLERPSDDMVIIHLRTPRSNTLRFLAGQYAMLSVGERFEQTASIASCPCDNMNLQFHFRHAPRGAFSHHVSSELNTGDEVLVEGPSGSFTLEDDSTRPLIFVAFDVGFAPIKSLIEHAISLEMTQPMHLYWLASPGTTHYLNNFCRSLADAIDNFHYAPSAIDAANPLHTIENALREVSQFDACDMYAAGDAESLGNLKRCVHSLGLRISGFHSESIDESGRLIPSEASHVPS